MIESLFTLPMRRPRLTLLVALVLTIASVLMALRLKPETSIEGLLDPTDPSVAAMGQVMRRFPVVEELLILATLPADSPADAAKLIAFAERFEASATAARDAAGAPIVQHVRYRPDADAFAFVQKIVVPNGLYYLDDTDYAEALRRLTRAGMDEQFERGRAAMSVPGPAASAMGKLLLKDPLRLLELMKSQLARLSPGGFTAATTVDPTGTPGRAPFFSPDGRSLLLRVSGTRPPSDLDFCRTITDAVTHAVADANADGLDVKIAGAYAVAAHNADAIRRESILGVNGSIVGILILFALLYRRPLRLFTIAFVPMAMGIAWGFGLFAALRPTFTPLAAVIGGALAGIGIDYFIFVLTQHAGRGGDRSADAIDRTLRSLRSALFAAWVTSTVGFFAVAWSPVRVLRDFALLGTLALGGALVAVLFVLPAAMRLFGGRAGDASTLAAPIRVTHPLGRLVNGRPRATLIVASIGLLAGVGYLLLAGRSAAPASSLLLLHPTPNPPLEAQREITRVMGIAPGSVQLYLQAASPQQLLRLAHEVDRRLRAPALDDVGRTGAFSVASVLPDPDVAAARRAAVDPTLADRAALDLPAAAEAAGFNGESFDPYIEVLRLLVAPGPPPGIDALLAYPSIAQLVLPRDAIAGAPATDALCMVFFDHPLDVREQRDAAIDALDETLAGVEGVTITGMALIGRELEASVRRDLPVLVLIAVVCIALVHAVHFGSIGLALLSIVPTAVSATAVLVFMSVTDQPLNIVNMVMVPLLLGIDTDYGILTVTAWMHAKDRRELADAFPGVATAVLTCAGTTIIGFGSLVFVSIPAIASLGWLINVGIVACLAGTLFVVWPMMVLMTRRSDDAA